MDLLFRGNLMQVRVKIKLFQILDPAEQFYNLYKEVLYQIKFLAPTKLIQYNYYQELCMRILRSIQ